MIMRKPPPQKKNKKEKKIKKNIGNYSGLYIHFGSGLPRQPRHRMRKPTRSPTLSMWVRGLACGGTRVWGSGIRLGLGVLVVANLCVRVWFKGLGLRFLVLEFGFRNSKTASCIQEDALNHSRDTAQI